MKIYLFLVILVSDRSDCSGRCFLGIFLKISQGFCTSWNALLEMLSKGFR
jgi:hypothetical protein